ncbi:MAG: hypothetical protein VR73_13750 [Gammaproteobacteria bacterium BRH_c0]|nr:MAG: hypothetical protein VR73_13750 [Gammaproteobacteria bacterium BRH_c0]
MPVQLLQQPEIDAGMSPESGKKRSEYCDKETPGLYLEARAGSASNTYYLRYKNADKKTCHHYLGRTSDITLTQAREMATDLKAKIAGGYNPKADTPVAEGAITYSRYMKEYYLAHAKNHKRSWEADKRMFEQRLDKEFGCLPLDQLTRTMISRFHTGLKESGLAAATANRFLALIRHSLNLAMDWEMLEKNPASKVKMFREPVEDKVLTPEELKRLLAFLVKKKTNVAYLARLLLSTGARVQEALKAQWSDINLDRHLWVIPQTNSKSKKTRSVPLNDAAITILKELPTFGKGGYLFVGADGKTRLAWPGQVWCRYRRSEEVNLPNLRLHDLRHAYASTLAASGVSLYQIQHLLGHASPVMTQRYAHLVTDNLLEASNHAANAINQAMAANGG